LDRFCHHNLTFQWSVEEGFPRSVAREIARANEVLDEKWWGKPWAHFALAGASLFSSFCFVLSLIGKSPKLLGYALHARQDSLGHGLIFPWQHRGCFPEIDSWAKASEEKKGKIEKASRLLLKKASWRWRG